MLITYPATLHLRRYAIKSK